MHILIVEDSAIEAVLLARTLKKVLPEIAEIVHKDTMQGAKEYLKDAKGGVDLVFMDLGLPDSEGWRETYRAISPYTGRLPVIVMTSNKSHDAVEELLKHGVEDYIIKGSKRLDTDLLRETIEFALLRHKVIHNLSRRVEEKDQCLHWLTGGYSVC